MARPPVQIFRFLVLALLAVVGLAAKPEVHAHSREEGQALAASLLKKAAAQFEAETGAAPASHGRKLQAAAETTSHSGVRMTAHTKEDGAKLAEELLAKYEARAAH